MREGDIAFACAVTDLEHWGYTDADFRRLMRLEPQGCLVAEGGGERVGLATVTTYGEVAWIGAVIVSPAARGSGVGDALLKRALDLCDSRGVTSARLNSYLNVVEFYRRLGFRGETENARCSGSGMGGFSGGRARPVEELGSIEAFDTRFFGAYRGTLLRDLQHDPTATLLMVEREGRPLGYIAFTAAGDECEIGPWIVEPGEPVAAATLLEEAVAASGARSFSLTCPLANAAAAEALAAQGFEERFRTLRMTRGRPVREDLRGIWALGGLEKG